MTSHREVACGEEEPIPFNSWIGGEWNNPRKLLKDVPPPPVPRSLGNWRNRDIVAAHSAIEALVQAQYQCGGEPMGDIHRLLVNEPKPIWANQDRMRLPQVNGGNVGTKKPTKRCCDPKKACKGIPRTKPDFHRPHSASDAPPRRIPPVPPISSERFEDHAEQEILHSPPKSPQDQPCNLGRTSDKLMDVGIDSEVAPFLHDRLSQLATQNVSEEQSVSVWVIIECCRDCANHCKTLRHDERAYLARFLQLKEAIERMFSGGVSVELLVPRVAPESCCLGSSSAYTDTVGYCERRYEADSHRSAGYSASRQTPQTQRPLAQAEVAPAWRPSSAVPGPSPASEPRTKTLQAGQTRIGSFEVYLCCTSSLILEGGTSLTTVAKCQGGAAALQACRRKDDFKGMCLASKLKARAWPVADIVLAKLVAAMPSVSCTVSVHTDLEAPVPGVQISAFQTQAIGHKTQRPISARTKYEELKMMPGTACSPVACGKTDREGILQIALPVCRPVRLQACHSIYLQQEEREMQVTPQTSEVAFIADTVTQFWQVEEEDELVVYCSSPLSTAAPNSQLIPFQGSVELSTGEIKQPDESGYLRGDVCKDIDTLHCDGWRSAPSERDILVHGTGRFVELGRLHFPKAEASLVAQCCKSNIHGARIFLDGAFVGTTSCAENRRRLSCGVRCGEHVIRAEHFLVPEGVKYPFSMVGPTSIGLEVPLPLERLRFVCVAHTDRNDSPGKSRSSRADLWLVGGDLAAWRASPDGPEHDAEIWLWEGELRHRLPETQFKLEKWESIQVQGGAINGADLEAVCRQREECEFESDECCFSTALTFPTSCDAWKPTLHPAGQRHDCAVAHLASSPCAPAIWIAQLSDLRNPEKTRQKQDLSTSSQSLSLSSPQSPHQKTKNPPRVVVKNKFCGCKFEGLRISVNGNDAGRTDKDGRLQADDDNAGSRPGSACSTPRGGWETRYGTFASDLTHIKINGVPPCLLPGYTNEYVVHSEHAGNTDIALDVACLFWIWWLPPDTEEDTTYDDDSDMDYVPEGTVSIAASSDQIPDEARPLSGSIECQGTKIKLDGQSFGPWPLRPQRSSDHCDSDKSSNQSYSDDDDELCAISKLTVRPDEIDGFTYRPKEESPFMERCTEVGGCELQRLAECPVVVGYLRPRDGLKK